MSTLAVNTITAETGNTVSLASGKTLDASQGFVPPAGHVVQFKHSVNQTTSSSNLSGATDSAIYYGANRGGRRYTEARSIVITPTSTSSILYCFGSIGWTSMAPTTTMGHGGIITRNDGTDSIDNSDYPWYQHSYIASQNLYYPPTTVVGIFSPSSTSAQTIKLRPFLYIEVGQGQINWQSSSLFVMEITQ